MTIASTTVFVAVVVLWGLSYLRVLGLSNTLHKGAQVRGESGIWSTGGRVLLDTTRHTDVSRMPGLRGATFSNDPYVDRPEFVDEPSVTRWHTLGFRAAQTSMTAGDGTGTEFAAMTVPYWSLAAVASVAPMASAGRALARRRRVRRGQCESCGYDLRGAAGPCPECGAARDVQPAPVIP